MISIRSPSFTRPIGPPSLASGETCPIHGPRVPPEKRPSVIRATDSSRPMPAICGCGCQHFTHSRTSFGTFVTDNDNVSGLHIPCKNALHGIFFTIIHPCGTCMDTHFRVNRNLLYNRAVGSKASFENCNSPFGMDWLLKGCNDLFIQLRVNYVKLIQVFPNSFAVNCKLAKVKVLQASLCITASTPPALSKCSMKFGPPGLREIR